MWHFWFRGNYATIKSIAIVSTDDSKVHRGIALATFFFLFLRRQISGN